jgi:hypothetical protein
VQFFLNANRVNSKGKLSAMNQLEKWHADGVIRLSSLKMRRAKRSQVGMREEDESPERIGRSSKFRRRRTTKKARPMSHTDRAEALPCRALSRLCRALPRLPGYAAPLPGRAAPYQAA